MSECCQAPSSRGYAIADGCQADDSGMMAGSFLSAYYYLKKGRAIKRPGWGGYWMLGKDGGLEMHLADGSVKTNDWDIMLTLENCASNYWYVLGKKELKDINNMLLKVSLYNSCKQSFSVE